MHKLFSFKTQFYLAFNLAGDNFASFYTEKVAAISYLPTESSQKLLKCSLPTTCPLDPIPIAVLPTGAPTITLANTRMISSCLSTSTFPSTFKDILKKTLPQSDSSYCWVPSLTSCLTCANLGFESGHSPVMALFVMETPALSSVVILLDLSAAFNTISCSVLLSICHGYHWQSCLKIKKGEKIQLMICTSA